MFVTVQLRLALLKINVMNKEKEEQVEELVKNFDMKLADGTNLNKFAEDLSNIFGYEFKNKSEPTQVDNQWFSFHLA